MFNNQNYIRFVMKQARLLLIIVCSLYGCKRSIPEHLFEKDGVSFISPEGWKIVDERNIEDSGYYVSCQRKGFGSNGIFMVSWINGLMELDKYIRLYMKEFERNVLMKTANIQFEEPVDSVFIGISCSMSTYKAKILGVETRGEIYSFTCSGRTFMLVFQESADESVKNKNGFEKIKNSFSCHSDKSESIKYIPEKHIKSQHRLKCDSRYSFSFL